MDTRSDGTNGQGGTFANRLQGRKAVRRSVSYAYILSPPDRLPSRLSSVDGGDDMEGVIVAAFQRYCVSNPLHPDVFPAIRKMEAEIVAMCLRMYNNPTGAGATTSGGTESILVSVKTHRDWARAVKGISEPEMYASVQSHLAYTLKMLVGCPQGCPSVGPRCV